MARVANQELLRLRGHPPPHQRAPRSRTIPARLLSSLSSLHRYGSGSTRQTPVPALAAPAPPGDLPFASGPGAASSFPAGPPPEAPDPVPPAPAAPGHGSAAASLPDAAATGAGPDVLDLLPLPFPDTHQLADYRTQLTDAVGQLSVGSQLRHMLSEPVPMHRCILAARSSYFGAVLRYSPGIQFLVCPGLTRREVILLVLWLYTGRLELTFSLDAWPGHGLDPAAPTELQWPPEARSRSRPRGSPVGPPGAVTGGAVTGGAVTGGAAAAAGATGAAGLADPGQPTAGLPTAAPQPAVPATAGAVAAAPGATVAATGSPPDQPAPLGPRPLQLWPCPPESALILSLQAGFFLGPEARCPPLTGLAARRADLPHAAPVQLTTAGHLARQAKNAYFSNPHQLTDADLLHLACTAHILRPSYPVLGDLDAWIREQLCKRLATSASAHLSHSQRRIVRALATIPGPLPDSAAVMLPHQTLSMYLASRVDALSTSLSMLHHRLGRLETGPPPPTDAPPAHHGYPPGAQHHPDAPHRTPPPAPLPAAPPAAPLARPATAPSSSRPESPAEP